MGSDPKIPIALRVIIRRISSRKYFSLKLSAALSASIPE